MGLLSDIEAGVAAALAPMLVANGGVLKGIDVFRGSMKAYRAATGGPRPRALVAISGTWAATPAGVGVALTNLKVGVSFLEDSAGGDAVTMDGGASVDGGLYRMIEDGAALAHRAVIAQAGGKPVLAELAGGGIVIDEEKEDVVGTLDFNVTGLDEFRFTTARRGTAAQF